MVNFMLGITEKSANENQFRTRPRDPVFAHPPLATQMIIRHPYGMKKILIAEDDALLSSILVNHMAAMGYETTAALDGLQTMEHLRASKPDILLLDIMMPGKDGVEILEEMRADPTLVSIPVIVLTNLTSPEVLARLRKFNIAATLLKVDSTPKTIAENVERVLLEFVK